jgi:hypothetical protein
MTGIEDNHLLIKCKSTLFLLLLVSVVLKGQNHSNRFFSSGSEIVVDVLPGNDIFYSHPCDKGINIYDLAEVFQINAEKLLRENKINPKSPNNDGKIVKIPIYKNLILAKPAANHGKKPQLKLKYQVKKGDNLFRIAKEYFGTDVASLAMLNNKKTTDVKIGEELLIGWLDINMKDPKPTPKFTSNKIEERKLPSKPVVSPNKTTETKNQTPIVYPVKNTSEENEEDVKIVKYYLSDVIGFWDRTAVNSKSYFVLHDEAKIGTLMDVYNPMLKTHIKAKVIGKIPSHTYAEDIQIIISPALAKELGILDGRFKVNIKYEQ